MPLSRLDTIGRNFRNKKKQRRGTQVASYPVDSILLGNTWWKCESGCGHVHSGCKIREKVAWYSSVFQGHLWRHWTKCWSNILEIVAERGRLKMAGVRRYILDWAGLLQP